MSDSQEPKERSKISKTVLAATSVFGAVAAVMGFLSDSLSTFEQIQTISPEISLAQSQVVGALEKIDAPAPPTECIDEDVSLLDDLTQIAELVVGGGMGANRPRDQDAHKQAQALAAKHVDSALASALLARTQLAVGESPQTIKTTAVVARNLCPAWSYPVNLVGNAWFKAGELDEAEAAYRTSIGLAPDAPEPRFNLALIAVQRNDLDAAEQALTVLLEQHPHHGNANLVRAQVRMGKGDSEGALSDASTAVANDPTSPRAHALFGQAVQQMGDEEAAQQAFCKAKALGHAQGEALCPS